MEVAGLCEICGKPAKELHICSKCGRKVCEKHYAGNGLCVECAKGETDKGKKKKRGPASELFVPESAKPTQVGPGDVKH